MAAACIFNSRYHLTGAGAYKHKMKHLLKLLIVLLGFIVAITATSDLAQAQQTDPEVHPPARSSDSLPPSSSKKAKKLREGCTGKGICGKTKQGKEIKGQYRVW